MVLVYNTVFVKDGIDAKTWFLFKPHLKFLSLNQSMCLNQGFGKGHVWKGYAACRMRVKGVRHKSQWIKYWISKATEQTDGQHNKKTETINNHGNDSKMHKTKSVLSKAWAELSPAQRKERWKRNEDEEEVGGGVGRGVQVRRGKNPRQGKCLDKGKNTTNRYSVVLRTSKIHKTRRQASGFCSNTHLRSRFREPARRDTTRCWTKDTCLRMVKWGG